ncbi:MAG: hypothetical protein IIB60_04980 [Planctomycetes bacterium]|nr:hypothetical protein [Planctomycetota bacterium]MCH8966476.1 hypothetical protein [Planctomycetota bacterium]
MFNYDWFHGPAFESQREEAKRRCTCRQFPDVSEEDAAGNAELVAFRDALIARTLIYLRDGFSYEVKEIADVETRSHLVFECEPVDHQYKVGAFVVTLPFDEIVRVEVFAVHPNSKPEDFPQITGFHGAPDSGEPGHHEARPPTQPGI